MKRIRKRAIGAIGLAAGVATALPAAAQGFGIGIEIGPRYERPYYDEHSYGYPPPISGGGCYYDSLNGRVCTY